MKGRLRFALWLGAFFGALVALFVVLAALVAAGHAEEDQRVLRRVLEQRAPLLAFVALLVFIACSGTLRCSTTHGSSAGSTSRRAR